MDKKTDVRDPDEKVVEIEMERLRAFSNHPFKVIGDSQMIELQDSIKKYGVLNPLIVRPKIEGYYEIISGHRRKYAAEKLGYKKIPVIICMLQDDEAVVIMVDFNLQREQITPSEKAYAYKMKYEGSYENLLKADTVTGRMLRTKTPMKMEYRKPTGWYQVEHAKLHNLKDLSVKLPLGVMTVIAGVAGSGKSSLMEYFMSQYSGEVISIRQKDIGINLRSTPATYLDIADAIRALFAKANHVAQAYFSFNSKGACPACQGKGVIISDMAYMDSIETVCEVCHGTRYSEEVLKYQYKGKNIAEVMDMTVRQAIQFFEDADFVKKLDTLVQVGLGYLHLNQSMTTLSGGELQRVKLASKLDERGQIFILDEPTDGLHLDDIRRLMKLFNRMTDQGNTLFIIEHSLDVMKDADYIVELGPGGGLAGGSLLFAGTPKEMLEAERSVTREYLRESL